MTLINKLGSQQPQEILNNLQRIVAFEWKKKSWSGLFWPFSNFPLSSTARKLPTHNLFRPLMRYACCVWCSIIDAIQTAQHKDDSQCPPAVSLTTTTICWLLSCSPFCILAIGFMYLEFSRPYFCGQIQSSYSFKCFINLNLKST